MAMFSSSSNRLFTLKLLLMSTGVVSVAVMVKLSVQTIIDFATSKLPLIWNVILTWLRPPYVYILINCIIIGIVSSSKLLQNSSVEDSRSEIMASREPEKKILALDSEEMIEKVAKMRIKGGDETNDRLHNEDSMEISEKPPVSARFGHRKAVKSIPEGGKALRVSKPKRQDTLESTWRTITEGRSMPLARHLKKSDTFEQQMRNQANDESLNLAMSLGKLRKEASMSQDELNRRVEAFIKKFNEEMRLQREESLNQLQGMITRGSGQ